MTMRIEDFVISGTDDGDVDLLCPDPAGTCPQWQMAVSGSLGSAIRLAQRHIQRFHPSQCPGAPHQGHASSDWTCPLERA